MLKKKPKTELKVSKKNSVVSVAPTFLFITSKIPFCVPDASVSRRLVGTVLHVVEMLKALGD